MLYLLVFLAFIDVSKTEDLQPLLFFGHYVSYKKAWPVIELIGARANFTEHQR